MTSGGGKESDLVESILTFRESSRFETKRVGGKTERSLETIAAFANSDGGYLVLGVDDPGRETGAQRVYGVEENAEWLDELRRLVAQRFTPPLGPPNCKPPAFVPIACTLRNGSAGTIMLVSVESSRAVHSLVDGKTFVRLDKSNRAISAVEITELSLRRGSVSFVAQPVDVELDLLDTKYYRDYAGARRLTRALADAMRHVGLAKLDEDEIVRPTRSAVLLFGEDPAGLLNEKCCVRVFQYRGDQIAFGPSTNLIRPPRTIRGPLIEQIRTTTDVIVDALASGIRVGPLGFEVAQRYPVRVIREAVTNAILHRDYHVDADVQVRIFDHRIEIESPGAFPGGVTTENIGKGGSHPRNRQIVDHLREFSSPPNLDAGEGVPMMRNVMDQANLYPPIYLGPADLEREAVQVILFNEDQAPIWKQVEQYLSRHGTIGNAELRALMKRDTLRASKQLIEWVHAGLLVVANPDEGKRSRRYRRAGAEPFPTLFPDAPDKKKADD